MEINNNLTELKYLLRYTDYCIEELLDKVMADNRDDPEYSAVTLRNLIICLLRVNHILDDSYPIMNVKEYILATQYYTEEDYMAFEENRLKESTYYVGVQFSE